MSFFKDVIASLLKNAFEGHTKFSVADDTAVGANPVRSISLDAVPVEGNTIISLAWDGGEKLFEKTLDDQEASHQFDLISIDLAEVADLTKKGEYDSAKALMKKLGQKYAENTGDIVDTNLPKLHTTQAAVKPYPPCPCGHADPSHKWVPTSNYGEKYTCSECNTGEACELPEEFQPKHASEDDHLWRQAKISLTNVFPSGTKQEITFETSEELNAYQGKQPGKVDQDHIPLWDKTQKEKAPEAKDELAPPSLSYQDLEKEKQRDTEDMQKHIDEKIKTELESALQEKAASVFGPDQVELVKVLRKNGRNWDEIKKILVKDFGFDKDSTTIFVDEQREGSDPTGIEVEPVKEEPESPLTPPEELVSPETHEKLLQDHEDKKKDNSPVEEIEKAEEPAIKEESAQKEVTCPLCFVGFASKDLATQHMNDYHRMGQAKEINQLTESNFTPQDIMAISELDEIARADNDEIHKIAAPSDLNPLQEPIKESPTTPSQDVVPMGNKPKDHNAPQHGDRVFVTTDLSREKAGFEATFIKDIKGNHGEDLSIVETDQGDILEVASNRVVKTSEGSGAQDTEPVSEPQIEMPKEEEIPVTPKMDDFHTSSQNDLLTLKAEVDALLKKAFEEHKTLFAFPKDGLKKEAASSDSAFEGNAWVRVWVEQDDVELDKRYAEVLKLPDEDARIAALKEIAKDIAYSNLHEAAEETGKYYTELNTDSLVPSDHDRIDWYALANPVSESEEDRRFEEEMGRKYGPDAAIPPKPAQSSQKSKLEKRANQESVEDYIGFLQETLIPDLVASGSEATAEDFEKVVELLKSGSKDLGYVDWLLNTLIPDLVDSGKVATAEDFLEGIYWMTGKQHPLPKSENYDSEGFAKDPGGWTMQGDASLKQADNVMETKCEDCGKELGPEVFLSKWPVCGACTRKKHKKVTQGSDFEKGISQNKTSDEVKPEKKKQTLKDPNINPYEHHWDLEWEAGDPCKLCKSPIDENCQCTNAACEFHRMGQAYDATKPADFGSPQLRLFNSKKTAAEPEVAPKTQFKDYKITPKYTPKEQAVPATPEIGEMLNKIESLQSNLDTLATARKQIEAKMKEELAKIDEQGERAQAEAALQDSIEKAAVLISALDNKVVQWKDKLYTLQTEQVDYVPKLTPKEMLSKIYAKFEGAEKYVQDVLNGMLSQAKSVMEKTLIRWPNKKSSVNKEASVLDDMNHYNEELLAALKELSSPL